ncbi:hypothetical protein [uncultured Croceitalea sp.]|uniref:hypothetical protein n=1 Tax=uncultured Croceitalea sp. TaxID=1798908 RepID=UPI0033064AFB
MVISKQNLEDNFFITQNSKEEIVSAIIYELTLETATITTIKNNLGFVRLSEDIFDQVERELRNIFRTRKNRKKIIMGYDHKLHPISELAIYYNALGIINFLRRNIKDSFKLFNKALNFLCVYEAPLINLSLATQTMA